LVDIWGEWCPPCKEVTSAVESLETKYKDKMDFFSLDVGKERDVIELGVRALPTVIIFNDGKVRDMFIGASAAVRAEEKIEVLFGIKKEHLR